MKKIPRYTVSDQYSNKFIILGEFAKHALNNNWTKEEVQKFIDLIINKEIYEMMVDIQSIME